MTGAGATGQQVETGAGCACGLVSCAECRERWLGPACRVCGASERAHSFLSGLHQFEIQAEARTVDTEPPSCCAHGWQDAPRWRRCQR